MGMSVMKFASKEVPKNVKTALQPRGNESFIVNTDFMGVKGQIPIVNFYEQLPRYPLQDLVGLMACNARFLFLAAKLIGKHRS